MENLHTISGQRSGAEGRVVFGIYRQFPRMIAGQGTARAYGYIAELLLGTAS